MLISGGRSGLQMQPEKKACFLSWAEPMGSDQRKSMLSFWGWQRVGEKACFLSPYLRAARRLGLAWEKKHAYSWLAAGGGAPSSAAYVFSRRSLRPRSLVAHLRADRPRL